MDSSPKLGYKIEYLHCLTCGKQASTGYIPLKTDTPDGGLIIRAWIDCPECMEKKMLVEIQKAECQCVIKNREDGETEREWFKRWMCMHHWMQTDYYQAKLEPKHEWEFYANGSYCKKCGVAIGSGTPCI